MAKNRTMEDMVPRKKKAQEIEVPVKKVAPMVQENPVKDSKEEFFRKRPEIQPKKPGIRRWYAENDSSVVSFWHSKWKYIAVFSVLAAASVFIGTMTFFGKTIIQVTPRTESFTVDASFDVSRKNNSEIGLETLRFVSELEKTSPVSGSKKIERSASGRIIIYNTFSKDPQILVRRTRFETPDGKIYRLNANTTIPGSTLEDGKIKPGSIEVDVTADAPGESYNTGLTDFTIPGFKGTPRYDKFYARSKTTMSGGFSGISAAIAKNDLNSLESDIKRELNEKFLAQVRQELPAGFVIPEGGTILTVENIDRSHEIGDPTSMLSMTIKANFIAFALKLEYIEQEIIDKYLENKENDNIKIQNLETISFKSKNPDFINQKLTLVITGEARAVWQFDETKLKNDLITAPRKSRLEIFNKYPEIVRAQIVFWPSWWRFFPKKPENIDILRQDQGKY